MPLSVHVLWAFTKVVSLFSWEQLQRIGGVLGAFWYCVLRIRRHTVEANLRLVFPTWEKGKIQQTALNAYRQMCINVLELCKQHADVADALQRVSIVGKANFDACYRRGNGVIVVTAHMGNFDLLACDQAHRGIPLAVVSKVLHRSGMNAFWMRLRKDSGLTIFEEGRSPREVLKWLKRGNVLGLVVDQRASVKRNGEQVPFFGYGVWTSVAPVRLARHTGAAIVPVVITRRPNGTHLITIEPELEMGDASVSDVEYMRCLHERLERWIRTSPSQWMWLHRRFKNAQKV